MNTASPVSMLTPPVRKPDENARAEILALHLAGKQRGVAATVLKDIAINECDGMTGRNLEHMCKMALANADAAGTSLTEQHLREAVVSMQNQIKYK